MYLSAKRTAGSLNLRSKRKQSFYQRKSGFPIYNASSAEKGVQKAKVPITKHVV